LSKYLERVKKQISMRLSELIPGEIRDPRAHRADTVTVMAVRLTPDLRYARVLVSIKSDDETVQREAMEAIEHSASFLRKALGERVSLRRVPELSFLLDETSKSAEKIEEILRELAAERGPSGEED